MMSLDGTDEKVYKVSHAIGFKTLIYPKGFTLKMSEYGSLDAELIAHEPTVKQWSGPQDGLPPIGTLCEFMWNYKREGSEYVKVRVLHHDGGSAIVRILEGAGKGSLKENRGGDCGNHPIFRAIKTLEQLAAEQRETAILDLASEISGYTGREDPKVAHEKLAAYLFDQGFKREVV